MINQLILQANLVADPELKHTPNDIAVCKFRVAWNDGKEDKRKTLFLDCIAWRSTAEFVCKYFKKGSQILVQGNLLTEQYEKDGTTRYSTELVIDKCHFCGNKKDSSQQEFTNRSEQYQSSNKNNSVRYTQNKFDMNNTMEEDEDLPF